MFFSEASNIITVQMLSYQSKQQQIKHESAYYKLYFKTVAQFF